MLKDNNIRYPSNTRGFQQWGKPESFVRCAENRLQKVLKAVENKGIYFANTKDFA